MDKQSNQVDWYKRYYKRSGSRRNDLRTNREVLFQTLALEASVVRAFGKIQHDYSKAVVLDIGCGGGGDLFHLVRVGYDPSQITGIDIQEDRIKVAQRLYPQSKLLLGDATHIDFKDNQFDMLYESTMFATLPNERDREAIASEMIRVCKKGGYLLLVDWRTPKIGDVNYKALTKKEIRKLFSIGKKTFLKGIYKGALIPPLGRFLSKHAPYLYFLVACIFPFLVGQVVYVLIKAQMEPYDKTVL